MRHNILRRLIAPAVALAIPMAVHASGEPEVPSWMTVDHAAKTVTMTVVAGQTTDNNNWNYNGMAHGQGTIVVPVGYQVSITFENNDPTMMVHSIGVGQTAETSLPMFTDPQPVFAGAMSSNPTDPMNATKNGESETITFVADAAGDYALICYTPGHALTGMWIGFNVSAEGEAGLDS